MANACLFHHLTDAEIGVIANHPSRGRVASCASSRRRPVAQWISKGRGIIAVASGLVQVRIAGGTPAIRSGEVLVADSERIDGWRNIGGGEAALFWIVVAPEGAGRSPRFG